MKKETYTKVFLKQLGKSTDQFSIKEHLRLWWKNQREKDQGGLRLTEQGLDVVKQIGVETYTIAYPQDLELTANIVIFLDHYIDTPYYIDSTAITLTNDKKAVELTLFSGDLRRYGFVKAMTRAKNNNKNKKNS
jgi:hypothetical protein